MEDNGGFIGALEIHITSRCGELQTSYAPSRKRCRGGEKCTVVQYSSRAEVQDEIFIDDDV